MKIYKIVLFIFIAIATLGAICYIFPADGIQIGTMALRFPSLEKILTRNSAQIKEIEEVESMEDIIRKQELSNHQDSLNTYKELITNHISRFYFPNDDLTYFDDFFNKVTSARANGKIIRIVHYGDSQIELDRISKDIRTFFQKRFGGGGPGLLPVVQTVPTSTVTQWASESFTPYMAYGAESRDREKMYGIMAKYYRVYGSGTCRISNTRTNKIRLILNDKKGNFKVTLKNKEANIEEEKVCDSLLGLKIVEWNLPLSISSFSLNFEGFADLHGMMVDNGCGVAVDNIPMRGCSGTIFTQINSQLLQQTYSQTDVGMIILQYGGNTIPGLHGDKGVEYYKMQIGNQIRRIKSLNPGVPILFIGPSDMATKVNGELRSYPILAKTVQALKEAALENGAAFWNIYEVMGGENSMITWAQNGLAGTDYVHFTPAGANRIGKYLTDAFATVYDYHQVTHHQPVLTAEPK